MEIVFASFQKGDLLIVVTKMSAMVSTQALTEKNMDHVSLLLYLTANGTFLNHLSHNRTLFT